MMFGQLAQAKSLREISDGLACCEGKLNHLGLQEGPKRSTLSYANAKRPWQLFEQVFYDQLGLAQSLAPKKKLRFKNKLLSLARKTHKKASKAASYFCKLLVLNNVKFTKRTPLR
jgi:hypothetical protein